MSEELPPGSAERSPAACFRALPKGETARPMPLPKRIGSYRILALLGQGGMWGCYKATQDHPPGGPQGARPGATSANLDAARF